MNSQPFFSVAVVCLNAERLIGATIESALAQGCQDFEIVVKDGLSNDGTLGALPKDPRIRVFAERDAGIYDAMNQATQKARGRYIVFMNCGDVFASEGVLAAAKAHLQAHPAAIGYGDYQRDGILHRQPERVTPFFLYRTPLCHQTMFFDAQILRAQGGYDARYKILADYDAELRYLFGGQTLSHMALCVCDYLGGGLSETEQGIRIKNAERRALLKKHYPAATRLKFGLKNQLTLPWLRRRLMGANGPRWLQRVYQALVNRINARK